MFVFHSFGSLFFIRIFPSDHCLVAPITSLEYCLQNPSHKPLNSTNPNLNPKRISIESLTEIESLAENLMKAHQNLDENIKEHQGKKFDIINLIKESLSKLKAGRSILTVCNKRKCKRYLRAYKKTIKLLEVVREASRWIRNYRNCRRRSKN